jgi:hypothetical protein
VGSLLRISFAFWAKPAVASAVALEMEAPPVTPTGQAPRRPARARTRQTSAMSLASWEPRVAWRPTLPRAGPAPEGYGQLHRHTGERRARGCWPVRLRDRWRRRQRQRWRAWWFRFGWAAWKPWGERWKRQHGPGGGGPPPGERHAGPESLDPAPRLPVKRGVRVVKAAGPAAAMFSTAPG